MERITQGYLSAAVHRVVRQPAVERYSMPFEVKPNAEVVLRPINTPMISEFKQSGGRQANALTQDKIHMAGCDECGKYIIGMRHKCTSCPDYDLCEPCFKKNIQFKFHRHTFDDIARPKVDSEEEEQPMKTSDFFRMIQMKRELRKMCRLIEE
jgi:hypothetical protein